MKTPKQDPEAEVTEPHVIRKRVSRKRRHEVDFTLVLFSIGGVLFGLFFALLIPVPLVLEYFGFSTDNLIDIFSLVNIWLLYLGMTFLSLAMLWNLYELTHLHKHRIDSEDVFLISAAVLWQLFFVPIGVREYVSHESGVFVGKVILGIFVLILAVAGIMRIREWSGPPADSSSSGSGVGGLFAVLFGLWILSGLKIEKKTSESIPDISPDFNSVPDIADDSDDPLGILDELEKNRGLF